MKRMVQKRDHKRWLGGYIAAAQRWKGRHDWASLWALAPQPSTLHSYLHYATPTRRRKAVQENSR